MLKNLIGLKSPEGHRFGKTFTKVLIFCQRTRASFKALSVFQALFAGPRSFFNMFFPQRAGLRTEFWSKTKKMCYKARQMRRQSKIRVSLVFNRARSRQKAGDLSP